MSTLFINSKLHLHLWEQFKKYHITSHITYMNNKKQFQIHTSMCSKHVHKKNNEDIPFKFVLRKHFMGKFPGSMFPASLAKPRPQHTENKSVTLPDLFSGPSDLLKVNPQLKKAFLHLCRKYVSYTFQVRHKVCKMWHLKYSFRH